MSDVDESYLLNHKRPGHGRTPESLHSPRPVFDSPPCNYTEAVSRLKLLLQKYHSQQNPVITAANPSASSSYFPDPDELTELLDRQYAVVEHLQAKVDYFKEALGLLREKTNAVCQENQALLDQLKDQTVNQFLEHKKQQPKKKRSGTKRGYSTGNLEEQFDDTREDESEEWSQMDDSLGTQNITREMNEQLFLSPKERKFVMKMEDEVDKIRRLHEGKTKQLESVLYSARDEIEEYQRQMAKLEDKLRTREVIHVAEHPDEPVLCVKCGHQKAVLSSTHGDALTRTMEKLKRERDDVMETLAKQNSSISNCRQRELDAYTQVKKSCDMVEQAQLEKAQAIIQVQQLKQELQQQKERHDKYITAASERDARERDELRSECQKQIDALNGKIQTASDDLASTENKLERVTREKVAVQSELELAKAQILANTADVSKVSQHTLKELTEAQVKHSLAVHEISSLKTDVQTTHRQREQERTRSATEMSELRRRLGEAEGGWMESKEECLRLTERLDNAEREAKTATATRKNVEQARNNDVKRMTQHTNQREQHMAAVLHDTEKRHTQDRVVLEHMLESQLQISDRLKEECRKLSLQLEGTSAKSRADLRNAAQEAEQKKVELATTTSKYKILENQVKQKDKHANKLTKKITTLDNNVKIYAQQIYELLIKQNTLMKERQALTREIDYWRQQLIQSRKQDDVTPADTESNASITDNKDT